MEVLIAPNSHGNATTFDRLVEWSAAGLIDPFVWWTVPTQGINGMGYSVRVVEAGVVQEKPLAESIERITSFRVFSVHTANPGHEIASDEARSVDSAFDAARRDGIFTRLHKREWNFTRVAIPASVETLIPDELFTNATELNLLVSPEDRERPDRPNRLGETEGDYVAHAAHAICCISDLWIALEATNPITALAEERKDMVTPVYVVRTYSRCLDFGYLLDHVATATLKAPERWPNPDVTRFVATTRRDEQRRVVDRLVRDFMSKHADVIGCKEFEPFTPPPPVRLKLLEALKLLWRMLVARVKRAPFVVADRLLGSIYESIRGGVEKFGVLVEPWREDDQPLDSFDKLGGDLDELPLTADDGNFSAAWIDLRNMAMAVVDGSDTPEAIGPHEQVPGRKRLIVTEQDAVVPDPRLRPPGVDASSEFACDPLEFDPEFAVPDPAGSDSSALLAKESTESAREDPGPESSPFMNWVEGARRSLVWQVGVHLSRNLRSAEGISLEDFEAEVAENDKRREELVQELEKSSKKRITWLFARCVALFMLGAVMAALAIIFLEPWQAAGLSLLLFFTWPLFCAFMTVKFNTRNQEASAEIQELIYASINAKLRHGLAVRDLARLRRRYADYLRWAQVIGYVVHRPWVGRPLTNSDLPQPLNHDLLPDAMIAANADTTEQIELLSSRAGQRLFTPGWMSRLYTAAQEGILKGHQTRLGIDTELEPIPEPALDDEHSDESQWFYLFRDSVKIGEKFKLKDSRLGEQLLQIVSGEDIDNIATDCVEVGSNSASLEALPPSAAWFDPPDDLPELSARLSRTVLKLSDGKGSGGSAVAISPDLVATARHCVDAVGESDELTLVDDAGEVRRARVTAISERSDLAVLRLVEGQFEHFTKLAAREYEYVQGTGVIAIGHPGLQKGDSTLGWGLITAARRVIEYSDDQVPGLGAFEGFQTTLQSAGGSSGCPIFTLDGILIGIRSGGADIEGTIENGLEFITLEAKATDLHDLINGSEEARESIEFAEEIDLRSKPDPVLPSGFLNEIFETFEGSMIMHGVIDDDHDGRAIIEHADFGTDSAMLTGAEGANKVENFVDLEYMMPMRVIAYRIEATGRIDEKDLLALHNTGSAD